MYPLQFTQTLKSHTNIAISATISVALTKNYSIIGMSGLRGTPTDLTVH